MGMYFNWDADSKHMFGTYLERGFKSFDLLEINTDTKEIRKVYSESSDTHINNNNIFRRMDNGHPSLEQRNQDGISFI